MTMNVSMTRKNRHAGPNGSKSMTECMLWLWLAITRSQTSCSMTLCESVNFTARGMFDSQNTACLTQCKETEDKALAQTVEWREQLAYELADNAKIRDSLVSSDSIKGALRLQRGK